jgi:hypothetical protein
MPPKSNGASKRLYLFHFSEEAKKSITIVNPPMKRAFFIVFLFHFGTFFAQEESIDFNNVIGINTDNDALVAWENRDRYYTFGIGASLSFKARKLLGLQNWFSSKKTVFYTAGLRMEGYTPTNKVVTVLQREGDSIITFDRPFAGLFFGTLETTYGFERSFFKTGILMGIIGPSSGAGRLQRWIHDNVTDDGVFDGWRYQVPDQFILNFSGDFIYDFTPEASWFDIYGGAKARLGNLYIDASPVVGFRIGRFNNIGATAAFGNGLLAAKTDWELYLRSSFSANVAFFNATAQGRLFGPDFEYAVDKLNPFFLTMTQGIYFAYRRIILGFDHYFSYGEVIKKQRHIYARLDFKYRF